MDAWEEQIKSPNPMTGRDSRCHISERTILGGLGGSLARQTLGLLLFQ